MPFHRVDGSLTTERRRVERYGRCDASSYSFSATPPSTNFAILVGFDEIVLGHCAAEIICSDVANFVFARRVLTARRRCHHQRNLGFPYILCCHPCLMSSSVWINSGLTPYLPRRHRNPDSKSWFFRFRRSTTFAVDERQCAMGNLALCSHGAVIPRCLELVSSIS